MIEWIENYGILTSTSGRWKIVPNDSGSFTLFLNDFDLDFFTGTKEECKALAEKEQQMMDD